MVPLGRFDTGIGSVTGGTVTSPTQLDEVRVLLGVHPSQGVQD